MKALKYIVPILLIGIVFGSVWMASAGSAFERWWDENDPDMPPTGIKVDHAEYFRLRNEYLDMIRGYDTADQESRTNSILDMERSERALAARNAAEGRPAAASWTPLGPAPIPVSGSTSYSGRTVAIAVHPTNPNIVYSGAAQGGLYRSLDGGTTWTPLLDNALTLAVGAVAISPTNPSTVFVGTGEAGLCGSGCFIGVGLYRIDNADTTPVLSAVINKNSGGSDIFTGRAVSEIMVDPTNSNNVFVATTSGVAGIGQGTTGATLPNAGLYRSTNALSGDPRFDQVSITGTLGSSRSVSDIAIDPTDANRLIAGVIGSGGDGGIYLTTNALSPTPTFTRPVSNGDGSSLGRTEITFNRTGAVMTVYAATGTANGTLLKSVDGGATFNATAATTGFCSSQCFYDIAVTVDPTNADKIYLAGSPSLVFGRSSNGATTAMTSSSANLHVDSQVITVAPSNPNIVYFGSDGGIWKTMDVTATPIVWQSLNNTTYSATQFMGLATHPISRNYSIGGTQDNGTQFLAPDGVEWIRSDGGDGGFAVIDQNSPAGALTAAYHTYYNQTSSQIGFTRATTVVASGDPNWGTFYGCGGTANGINCADQVLFYAPMVHGPNASDSSSTNTLYFGTNHLYRSANLGATMADVSGTLPARIGAIGVAPLDDNVRLVGLTTGAVYRSTTFGATTMTDVTGSIPARYIGRIAIDPTNSNIAYVALNGFGLAAGQHVYKTTNLLSGTPTWSPAGLGIPDTPSNALAIDPSNTQVVYCGTDIGVFKSSDGGANWIPFSQGLPRVAVFGMEIQQSNRVLRIATHGRGMYEYDLAAKRAAFDYDGDGKTDASVYRPSNNAWYLLRSTDGFAAYQFGATGDSVVPADYTGDGKTDVAIWRPSNGTWYILRSEDLTVTGGPFGTVGDTAAPGDYDGDGKADLAVYRPGALSTFYVQESTNGFVAFSFGVAEDKPTLGDFDGDGKTDFAVYRPSQGAWYRFNSSNNGFYAVQFGQAGDKVVPADYTGDGKTDVAVWREATGTWYVLKSEDLQTVTGGGFGSPGDIPTPGDFDGDGKTDFAVYRPGAQGVFYTLQTTNGFTVIPWGLAGDIPTPNAYVK